ncbi:magnesium transporter CorA family protein [Facklamia miroungae]|uniref:Magnesium transporter n=1 Tax=Facklamia miroungae TaxID=120956 RepID=A0A1G7QJE3_9LACT|nr:magnesium transporter CorA family protein [Facklamia miroungae]NKZ28963.1 magnesium transporter CorA family protein [Facklamia miroungae]SDF98633.1 magnesium transporter [Facklamia miroungae]
MEIKNNTWQLYEGLNDLELEDICKNLAIPHDYLSGVNDPFEIARSEEALLDNGGTRSLIVLQYLFPQMNSREYREYKTRAISLVKVEDQLITALPETPSYLRDIFKEFNDSVGFDYEEMVMKVFWKIQNETIKVLAWIHEEIEAMQKDIEYSSQNQELYRLMSLDKTLAYIKTAVQNNRRVLEQISKNDQFQNIHRLKALMHDVLIESLQAESMVDEGMRIVDQLSDIFSNVISNNLNNVMKILTSITIILTIPTIIGGLWGMNVPVPFQEYGGGFIITTLLSILISIIVAIWLKSKDYL